MDPSIKLSSRNNLCNLSNPPYVDGMFPVKLLPDNWSVYKFFKEPIPIGICPFNWFSPAAKTLSESENFPMASGIVIFKGLMDKYSSSKNLQLVKDKKKLCSWSPGSAVSWFSVRPSHFRFFKFPRFLGICPERKLSSKATVMRLEKFERYDGIWPLILFTPSTRVSRLGQEIQVSNGRFPDKELKAKLVER